MRVPDVLFYLHFHSFHSSIEKHGGNDTNTTAQSLTF